MDEKVYTPEVIIENPYPTTTEQGQAVQTVSGSLPKDTYAPSSQKEQVFPIKRRAVELLSNSLNTRSRKVLQEFQLDQSGGFQIGNFQEGITGDLRITPNGLIARDISGNTTIAVDGTTGDVVLKGTLQSGSVVSGDIIVGGSENESGGLHALDENNIERVTVDKDGILVNDGKITVKNSSGVSIIDSYGLVSANAFSNNSAVYESNLTIVGNSYVDIPSLTFTFTLQRITYVLIAVTLTANHQDANGVFIGRVLVDGSEQGSKFVAGTGGVSTAITTGSVFIVSLASGSHTIKVQGKGNNASPSECYVIGDPYGASFSYSLLGS